jgi:hypothetical protein
MDCSYMFYGDVRTNFLNILTHTEQVNKYSDICIITQLMGSH